MTFPLRMVWSESAHFVILILIILSNALTFSEFPPCLLDI